MLGRPNSPGKVSQPRPSKYAVWTIFVAAAATLGTIRFLALADIVALHRYVSAWAATVGLPCMAVAYVCLKNQGRGGKYLGFWVIFFGVLTQLDWEFELPFVNEIVGVLSLGLIIYRSLKHKGSLPAAVAIVGCVLIIFAGLGIGTQGYCGPLPCVDIFHYTLALAYGAIVGHFAGVLKVMRREVAAS